MINRIRKNLLFTFFAGLFILSTYHVIFAQTFDDLIFIHHSVGNNWLDNSLNAALVAKDYIDERNDMYYDIDIAPDAGRPDSLGPVSGDNTDMNHWISWFNNYLGNLKTFGCASGVNKIIMFKSCYPNSDISLDGTEPGDPFYDADYTITNFKAIYRHPSGSGNTYTNGGYAYKPLEDIFAENPDTLFIAVTAPPLCNADTNDANGHRARTFNNWLKNDWLTSYNTAHPTLKNVAVFDFFDYMANADDAGTNPNRLKAIYGGSTDDSHPTAAGSAYATQVFATNPSNFIDMAWAAFNSTSNVTSRALGGYVRTAGAVAINNVTITLTGSVSSSTLTNSSGFYSFNVSTANGTYTITPALTDYTFAPTNRILINPTSSQTVLNFTGTSSVVSSGTVVCSFDAITDMEVNENPGDSVLTLETNASFFNQGTGSLKMVCTTGDYPGVVIPASSMGTSDWTGQTQVLFDVYSVGAAMFDYSIRNNAAQSHGWFDNELVDGWNTITIELSQATELTSGLNMTEVTIYILGAGQGGTVTFPHTLYIDNMRFPGGGGGNPTTYSISGTVETSTSAAIGGVTVTATGAGSGSTTTAADGTYTISSLANGTYTITPTKTSYTFSPSTRGVTISGANQTSIDFEGTYSGSGGGGSTPSVTNVACDFETLTDIAASESSTDAQISLVTTPGVTHGTNALQVVHSAGSYPGVEIDAAALAITDWSSYLTLKLDVYNAELSAVPVNILIDNTAHQRYEQDDISLTPGQNTISIDLAAIKTSTWTTNATVNAITLFIDPSAGATLPATLCYDYMRLESTAAPAATYSISGTVATSTSAAMDGVTISLSGAGAGTATTSAYGTYSFSGLANGSYVVTPVKTDYTFSPLNISVTVNGANLTGQNFTGTFTPETPAVEPTVPSGSVKVTDSEFNPRKGNNKTTIKCNLTKTGHVKIQVFSQSGQLIKTIYDGIANAGVLTRTWDGTDIASSVVGSGIYLVHIKSDDMDQVKKVCVVK